MSGYCKYYKQKKQVSYDNGVSWTDTGDYQKGDLYETNSTDCGYVGFITRWINSGTTCSGYDKYNLQIKQESYDGGSTWINVIPIETRQGTLIERNSTDCGYVPPTYEGQYLTIRAVGGGPALIRYDTFGYEENTMWFSSDSGLTWYTVSGAGATAYTAIAEGTTLWCKAHLTMHNSVYDTGQFFDNENGGSYEVEGNIMSLLYGDDFVGQTELENYSDGLLAHKFRNCNRLVGAKNLVLPATTLKADCYADMFSGCYYLKSIPSLPATTLAVGCYRNMFYGCENLKNIPNDYVLPATTLARNCYNMMFYGCMLLEDIPSALLPATTLAEGCYEYMFDACSRLKVAPSLPATNLPVNCYHRMFRHCRNITTTPDLNISTIAASACTDMFSGCTKLSTAHFVFSGTSASTSCCERMFGNCSSLSASIITLSATALAKNCYQSMFSNCLSLPSAPDLPATTLTESCYYYMFAGCTSLTTAPVLPAATLAKQCYNGMFYGCTNLNYIECLATNRSATDCTSNWVSGVASSGTFVKSSSANWGSCNVDKIPCNWTVQNI